MYIDPMTLFILAEILVVYIIINIFLFYKSRLYNVLVALLKEMRFERSRRQQKKQDEITALRESNSDLISKNESIEKLASSAGKTMTEQLEDRITDLTNGNPHVTDLLNSTELDQSSEWLRLRILELEKELLSGNINDDRWKEMAKETISRVIASDADHEENTQQRKASAEDERYTAQLEGDLSDTQRQLNEAKIHINQLKDELVDLQAISTPSESFMEPPERGKHDDEIYQLKCDNFDLQESINKLKLKLQEADPSIDKDEFIAILETQISNLEQYIKSADMASSLMEKESSASKEQIESLHEQLVNLTKTPGTVDTSSLKELGKYQEQQADSLASMSGTIERLRNGESPETIADEQEAYMAKLEQIIKESEQCINILEAELSRSSEDIQSLEDELSKSKKKQVNDRLSSLAGNQQDQKEGVSNIQGLIADLRSGGATTELLDKQEAEINKLQSFLAQSDMLIGQLESEIQELTERLNSTPIVEAQSDTPAMNSNEDMQEMESLLQQYIIDTQTMLGNLNKLEKENKQLKAKNEELKKSAVQQTDTPSESEPPVMIDIEPTAEEKANMNNA